MSVDAAIVKRIAHLARIRIEAADVAPLAGELNEILGWIEQLGEVDTTGIAPMTAVIPNHLKWRDDVVTDGGIQGQVLGNSRDAAFGFFAVPKVIE